MPARETRADGVTLERWIDRGRAEVALTDGEGRRTIRRYGAYGVLEEIEDPQGGRVRFTYDGRKQLTQVTNALGRHWTFTRDACGRVVSETDFEGRTTAYAYDRSGRLTGRTEADGTRLAYAYDAAGLLLAETVSAADGSAPQVTRFAYDRAGRLVRAQNREARVELERDALGQVVAETVNGRRIENTYDCCGHRVSRSGLGAGVTSVYDPLGGLAGLRIGEHAALSLGRDAAGRERHRATPVGFRLESRHDAVGRLVRQVGGGVGGPDAPAGPALERVYGWNRASEPVSIADILWGTTGYRYDGNGQVEEARHGDGLAERFDYDAALNVSAFQELDRGPGGPV
ncbi:RHS repeat protein, partial [Methylobacterium indicum]